MDSASSHLSEDVLIEHASFVRRLARSLLADEHAADDLAQDVLARYLEQPPRHVLDPRGWFTRVVRNLASNTQRGSAARRARERGAARGESSPSLDDELAQAELLRSVVGAVIALDEPYRSTVLARYFRGWEPARIARETETPVATVKSRLQRAHAELRARLDREHGSRSSWAVALGGLAHFGTTETALGGATTIALGAKWGLAAALAMSAALVGWRILGTRTSEPGPAAVVRESAVDRRASRAAGAPEAEAVAPSSRVRVAAAAPVASDGYRITGVVTDLAYEPLALAAGPAAGVELEVILLSGSGFRRKRLAEAQVTTESAGAFELDFAAQAEPATGVLVRAPETGERRGVHLQLEFDDGARALEGVEVSRAAHGLLEGLVIDEGERPLPHARLSVSTGWNEPRIELAGDPSGGIRVPWRTGVRAIQAVDAGRSVLGFEGGSPLESGGYTRLRVVLSSSASLVLRVLDARGDVIEDSSISVSLDASETRTAEGLSGGQAPSSHSAKSDATGAITLDRVWAGHKLFVSVRAADQSESASALRGSELLFGDEALGGAPIVLAPGERRELVARWRGDVVVAGHTLSRRGDRLAGVLVQVFDLGSGGAWSSSIAEQKSLPDGSFRLRVRSRELRGPLRVRATETTRPTGALQALGYANASPAAGDAGDWKDVELASANEGRLEVELVLDPTFTIAGRVVDSQGVPFTREGLGGIRLWAVPQGSPTHRDAAPLGDARTTLEKDGRFTIAGLSDGAWDLYVSEEIQSFYTWESFLHRFPAVAAGSEGVELRLPPREEVKVRLRLHADDLAGATILHGRLFPNDPALVRERAPRALRVDGVGGWPLGAVLGFAGISGDSDELGSWSFGFFSVESVAEVELPPMGPGWYVFGVHPSTADGATRWFPQATRLHYFEPGEHSVDFDCVPTTDLRGRVEGVPEGERWGVQLVALDGSPAPLEAQSGFGRPDATLELDAAGRFVVRNAPTGAFRLRTGTLVELARGEGRREVEVALEPGRRTDVVLRP